MQNPDRTGHIFGRNRPRKGKDLRIIQKKTDDLIPYEKNPRKNDAAVEKVAASIKEFGFKVPIIIDSDGVIIAGHTRLKAAGELGLKKVPCIVADDLTEKQIKAFRLADNKTAEFSDWDFELLTDELEELNDIDMAEFGFDLNALEEEPQKKDPEEAEREYQCVCPNCGHIFTAYIYTMNSDTLGKVICPCCGYEFDIQETTEEYEDFLEKFKLKKTTDDCYTPNKVYDAIAEWVANEYQLDRDHFIRPFYPGGNYQKEKYKPADVVVDNPPFSILAEILKWYTGKGIKFFLFAPALTLFSSSSSSSCAIGAGADIVYENKASVSTSFITNLEEGVRFRSAPTLYTAVKMAMDEVLKETRRELPRYSYPDEVMTAAKLSYFSKYGVDFSVKRDESERIGALDAQRAAGKAIFGKGYLISKRAAAERAAAERWQLSEREKRIVDSLEKEDVESQDKKSLH